MTFYVKMSSHIYDAIPVTGPRKHFSDLPVGFNICLQTYIGYSYDKSDGIPILSFDGVLNDSIVVANSSYYKAGDSVMMYLKKHKDGSIEYLFIPTDRTSWVSFLTDDNTIYNKIISGANEDILKFETKMKL